MTDKPRIEVAIALVWREGKLLVTRRQAGTHLAGYAEFPGGKLEPGETPEAAAEREVAEETGLIVRARAVRPRIDWDYPERSVMLHPVECDWVQGDGAPSSVSWCEPKALSERDFPAANAALIRELIASGRG